ncbi:MAG: mechanosensitive ion channel [Armatimonadota bacterium]
MASRSHEAVRRARAGPAWALLIALLAIWLLVPAALGQEAPSETAESRPSAPEAPVVVEPGPEAEAANAAEDEPGDVAAPDEEGAEEHAAPTEVERPEPPPPPPPRPTRSTTSHQLESRRTDIRRRGAKIEGELADAAARLADARARLLTLQRASSREPDAIRAGDRTSADAIQLQVDAQTAVKDFRQLSGDVQEGQGRATELLNGVRSDLQQHAAALSRSAFSDLRQQLDEQQANADELIGTWEAAAGVAVRGESVAARLSLAVITAQVYAREHSPWRRAEQRVSTRTPARALKGLRFAARRIGWALTTDLPAWLRDLRARLATPAGLVSVLVRLVVCGLLLVTAIYGWRRLVALARRRASAPDPEQPPEVSAAAAATLGIARALIILVVGGVAIWLCGFSGPWLGFLMTLLAIVVAVMLLENVTERLLSPAEPERRLVPATDEHAAHVYRSFRGLLVFSGVLLPLVFALRMFAYEHDDVVAAVDFVYGLGAWLYMFALLVPFGGPRALIPDTGSVAARMAQRTAVAIPTTALTLGAILLGVHAAGYTNLSQLLARAIPAAVLSIAAVWVLHRTYVFQAERRLAAISVEDAESADWRVFLRAARPLLGLVERIGMVVLAGAVIVRAGGLPQGRLRELSAVLSRPLFTVQDTEVSIWELASAALVVVFSILISRIIREVLQEAGTLRRQYDAGQRYAISNVVYYVLVVAAVLWAVRLAGFSLGALAVFAGVAGIGLAFGLQDILKNFISGLILLVEQPIKVGDYIDVGGGGPDSVRGIVTQISIRSTTVRTLGNVFVIVPNADFVTQQVLNLSHRDLKLRLDIDVGVSYASDVELVREILRKIGQDHPMTLNDPPPDARLMGFGDSSVDFRLLVWIADPTDRAQTTSELNFAVWHALQEHGIEIPFPQRDLHMRSDATIGDREALRPERADESPTEDA